MLKTAAADNRNDIFDALRAGFRRVAGQAAQVRINHERLAKYAAELPAAPLAKLLDPSHHYAGGAEDTAAYILALDSINFGSGYREPLEAEGWRTVDDSLYYTLSTRLKDYFNVHGTLTASAMMKLTAADAAAMLGLDATQPVSAGFAAMCAQALHEMGAFVQKNWNGSFLAMVDGANGSAGALLEQLTQLHGFHDVHSYRGQDIAFYKRAQIAVADLYLAFRHQGRILFDDMDRLTIFADNAVPHVLHTDGVLEYDPALAARIAAGEDIASGSPEEIEIRACAAHAAELIAQAKGMRVMDLDHILWHRSAEDPRYAATPAHRTLSRFY